MGEVTNDPLGVQWVIAGMLFVFGACIGSFLNVVIYRLPSGLSIVSPPSRCPKCKTQLRATDNIPIVSWLMLRGRCRTCAVWISARYPFVELLTAVVFARIGWLALDAVEMEKTMDLSGTTWLWLALRLSVASCLIVVGCWDLDRARIPVGFLWFVLAIGAAHVFSGRDTVYRLVAIALASLLAATVCFVESRFHRQTNWWSALTVGALGGMFENQAAIGLALITATFAQLVLTIRRNTAAFRLGWPALAVGGILAIIVRPESLPNWLTYPWLDVIGATFIVATLSVLTQVMARRQSLSSHSPDIPASHPEEAPWTKN